MRKMKRAYVTPRMWAMAIPTAGTLLAGSGGGGGFGDDPTEKEMEARFDEVLDLMTIDDI